MIWYESLAIMLGGLVVLLALGLPVAFAFFTINIIGALVFFSADAGLNLLARNTIDAVTKGEFAPIPLFLLMGELMYRSRLAERAIDAIDRIIVRVPGRLPVVAVTGGTIFSALSGSTMATTAMLGNTMLPDMLKRGYHPTMAMGPIMAVGGVDLLIPPSALTVLFASLAKIPVSELLIAGIIPGLIMSLLFIGYIVLRCWLDPRMAPVDVAPSRPFRERWMPFVKYVLPLFAIVFVVIGSMFAGIASPTESAALGCVATALLAAAYRAFNGKVLAVAMLKTTEITAMILFIIAPSLMFSQILALSGGTDGALAGIATLELNRFQFILAMIVLLIVLGTLIDELSMILLTLPFLMPLVASLQIDPVWFGILFLINMQIGLLSPPFGLLLFVMRGVAPPGTTMTQVFQAAMPFIGLMILVMMLIWAVPWFAVWLPGLIAK